MKRVIIFTGGIETQGFFSLEIARTLEALGHPVYDFNLEYDEKALLGLLRFLDRDNTVMLSFNFHGISGEEVFLREDGTLFWDEFHVPCINLVVDHPLYYPKFLAAIPKDYTHISIDRFHREYMRRHYPEVNAGIFLPLAGTALDEAGEPLSFVRGIRGEASEAVSPEAHRPYDIVFAGNYTPPADFERYITRLDDEYTAFYYGIIEDLLADPTRTLEAVAEEHIRREIPEVSEAELKETFPNLTFLDLYIRFYERGLAVKTLADAGFRIHIFGEGWEKLPLEHPENLILHGGCDSLTVLRAQAKAKLSLNVMPWFKDGAHDRVFNSCANGSVCLTDPSICFREIFEDGKQVCFFDLLDMKALPEMAGELLRNEGKRIGIAHAGQEKTLAAHLWTDRARRLHELMEGI